ncbi:MAG: hypothetical protein A2X22_10905 [Bacteroidetes bacterium GWF2_49_14]|nr:MAG: hypothetical protein A2X22_10905 [Bacteroidetes bacterium GWF2_49_14]
MFQENIRNAKVFAYFPAKVFLNVRVTGNCRCFSVTDIPVQSVITTLTDRFATVFFEVLDQFVSLHQKLKVMV